MKKASQAKKLHSLFQTLHLAGRFWSSSLSCQAPAVALLGQGSSGECLWAHTWQGGKERGCQTPSSECKGYTVWGYLGNEGHRNFLFHQHCFTYHKTILLLLKKGLISPHIWLLLQNFITQNTLIFSWKISRISLSILNIVLQVALLLPCTFSCPSACHLSYVLLSQASQALIMSPFQRGSALSQPSEEPSSILITECMCSP